MIEGQLPELIKSNPLVFVYGRDWQLVCRGRDGTLWVRAEKETGGGVCIDLSDPDLSLYIDGLTREICGLSYERQGMLYEFQSDFTYPSDYPWTDYEFKDACRKIVSLWMQDCFRGSRRILIDFMGFQSICESEHFGISLFARLNSKDDTSIDSITVDMLDLGTKTALQTLADRGKYAAPIEVQSVLFRFVKTIEYEKGCGANS